MLVVLLALVVFAAPPGAAQAREVATLVRDITPGPASTSLELYGVVNNTILFRANGPEGYELWRSDGTAAGTTVVKDIGPGIRGGLFGPKVLFNGKLFFGAVDAPGSDSQQPINLWRSDGTAGGTVLVKSFGSGGMAGNDFVVAQDALFFLAGGVWRSDGTTAGTAPVDPALSPLASGVPFAGTPNQLFFEAAGSGGTTNLFRTNGTAAGTRQLTQFQDSRLILTMPFVVGDQLFFDFYNRATASKEIWTSDGTVAGTRRLGGLSPRPGGISQYSQVAFKGRLYAGIYGGQSNTELIASDGTDARTEVIFASEEAIRPLTVIGDQLYFGSGNALYVSDGTRTGTRRFLDLGANDPPLYNPTEIFAFNGAIYFVAETPYGQQIWRTSGTSGGIQQITRIVGGVAGLSTFVGVGATTFFFAGDSAHGTELWKLVDDPNYVPAERVTEGLLARYTFDEGGGTTAHDTSGVGAPLDLKLSRSQGAFWGVNGLVLEGGGTALFSSGPASKIIDAAKASNEITVEFWLAPSDTVEQFSARIATISASPTRRNLSLIHGVFDTQQPTVVSVRIRTRSDILDGSRALYSPTGTLQARIIHLVYTRSSDGTVRLYVDGVKVAEDSRPGSLSSWDARYRLGLGGEIGGGRFWQGVYHLGAFYGRALSAVEVRQNYDAGPFEP